jgi:hypothetical protein
VDRGKRIVGPRERRLSPEFGDAEDQNDSRTRLRHIASSLVRMIAIALFAGVVYFVAPLLLEFRVSTQRLDLS